MFRILVAVDGSEPSNRTVSHLLKKLAWYKGPVEVHLLNVQPPLPSNVARFVPASQLNDYHRERAEEALAPARALFDAFPKSIKRGILEWIAQAKRSETREKRVRETAEKAERNERANQWRP